MILLMHGATMKTGNCIVRTKAKVIWRDGDSGRSKRKSAEGKRKKFCPCVRELVGAECF